ncbi:PHP domain-containing protein [Maribacter algarum]|uniref:PHP domain-containing protein n=1 Tax=Maribacter algarum (ex Zhang et al. 2020) TaxID=2578118 RepID=A0A5S3PSR6_9FLAO|nr:Sb-PDE family phosphodiesterase [Maribacter algarum]TMM57993.1 PHP domain-containing protein [Maribacter algarum]
MKKLTFLIVLICFVNNMNAQHTHQSEHALTYPNIEGYVSLKTDLHIHTVFSDGNVWPTIRVQEALRENLDAISLTEHLEYQPHLDDIPHPNRNRSYDLALAEAKEHDLLIVHGSEITRSAPMGHSNAVFIEDANPLLQDKGEKAFSEAKKQNAFVFWNHPAWHAQNPQGNPILSDFQKERIEKGELHGIEVINSVDYNEESLALALDQNLTIMGTSDIHGLIDWDYTEKGNDRPITLVFAKERTLESMQEALFAGRTVAVYNSLLVGKSEFLTPLIQSSITVTAAKYIPKTQVLEVQLNNISSSPLLFENAMDYGFYSSSPVFEIPAMGSYTLRIKTLEEKESIDLKLKAIGAFTAPKESPVVSWKIPVEK